MVNPQEKITELWEKYRFDVVRLARSLVQNPIIAEDVMQETLTRALAAIDKGAYDPLRQSTGEDKAWLLAITRNYILNLRNGRERREIKVDSGYLDSFESQNTGPDEFEQEMRCFDESLGEPKRQMLEAILKLPPGTIQLSEENLECLYLKYVDELSYKELGDITDCSKTAMGTRIARTKAKLRELAEEYSPAS